MKSITYLLAACLILSEICLRVNQNMGFVFYALVISGTLIALAYAKNLENEGRLIIVFMILPMLRVCELFLTFGLFFRIVFSGYLLFVLILIYSIRLKTDPGYNLKNLWMIALTIPIGLMSAFILNNIIQFDKDIRLMLVLPILVFAEEVYFRGMLQKEIQNNSGMIAGILISSLLYGVFSISLGWNVALGFFTIGLVCSILYALSKNIFVALPISFIANLILFAI